MIKTCVLADDPRALEQSGTTPGAAKASTSGRKSAHQVAAEHQQEVLVLKDLLRTKRLHNLPKRLDDNDAELIRYRQQDLFPNSLCLLTNF